MRSLFPPFLLNTAQALFPGWLSFAPALPSTPFFLASEPRVEGWPDTPGNTLIVIASTQTRIVFNPYGR